MGDFQTYVQMGRRMRIFTSLLAMMEIFGKASHPFHSIQLLSFAIRMVTSGQLIMTAICRSLIVVPFRYYRQGLLRMCQTKTLEYKQFVKKDMEIIIVFLTGGRRSLFK